MEDQAPKSHAACSFFISFFFISFLIMVFYRFPAYTALVLHCPLAGLAIAGIVRFSRDHGLYKYILRFGISIPELAISVLTLPVTGWLYFGHGVTVAGAMEPDDTFHKCMHCQNGSVGSKHNCRMPVS